MQSTVLSNATVPSLISGDDRYPITPTFLRYYTISTVFESFCMILFAQIFATSPIEFIYMHTYPYLLNTLAMAAVVVKRFLYLRIIRFVEVPTYLTVYVVLCCLSSVIHVLIVVPNLHGAMMFVDMPWTTTVGRLNGYFLLFCLLVVPPVTYGYIGQKLDTVVVIFKMENPDLSVLSQKTLARVSPAPSEFDKLVGNESSDPGGRGN